MSDRRRGREEGGSSSGGQSRRSRQKVMDASGQTVEERRQLRLEQRNLKSVIIEQQAEIGDLNKDTCRELTEKNAKLFDQTKFPREAVTDGENMKLIAEGAVAQVKKVTKGAVGVDGDSFLDRAKAVYSKNGSGEADGGNEFNWRKWGAATSVVFLAMPDGGSFMMGPLDKEEKLRKVAQRRQKIVDHEAEEVVPEEEFGKGRKKAKQNKDQTQTRISNMRDHEQRSGTFQTKKDLFETLINPNSFTQTVENMFDFSFFVKSGEAHVSIDEETKLPQVKFDNIPGAADSSKSKQWLMSFTPADFKELKDLYKLKESNLAHRDEGPKSDYYDPLVHGNRESNRQ